MWFYPLGKNVVEEVIGGGDQNLLKKLARFWRKIVA